MKFKAITETAILPVRKTMKAAGYDFYSDETVTIKPNEVVVISTGVVTEGMPEDKFLDVRLRSGTSINRPLLLANGAGVVDADYEETGEPIGIIVFNRSISIPVTIDQGERIAQGVILPYYTVDNEKKPTTKRTSGRGSTGTK